MKRITTLLFVLFTTSVFAQKQSAKEIVEASYRKMSGEMQLKSFKLDITFDTPGTLPEEFHELDSIPDFLASALEDLPDSSRAIFESGMRKGYQEYYETLRSRNSGLVITYFADLQRLSSAELRVASRAWRGQNDTTRTVYTGRYGSDLINRQAAVIWQLHDLRADSVALDYGGTAKIGGRLQHIIKVTKSPNKREIWIDAGTLLPSRIVNSHINNTPLMGSGPVYYKTIDALSDYTRIDGFLLPAKVEEISTDSPFTSRLFLKWGDVNVQFDSSLFAPEPPYEEKLRYGWTQISDRVFVLEQTGQRSDQRLLVRMTPDRTLQLFFDPTYNDIANRKMVGVIRKRFPGIKIESIFLTEPLSTVSSLLPFRDAESRLYTPENNQSNWKFYNPVEDSLWLVHKRGNVIVVFEAPFRQAGVMAIPVLDRYNFFAFYLPEEKTVFIKGTQKQTTMADSSPQLVEIELHRRVVAENLKVDKIVYSDPGSDLSVKFLDFAKWDQWMKRKDAPSK